MNANGGSCYQKIPADTRQAAPPMATVAGAPNRAAMTPANRTPKGGVSIIVIE
jgi:hypothetical protein